jgi:hypothetical protein
MGGRREYCAALEAAAEVQRQDPATSFRTERWTSPGLVHSGEESTAADANGRAGLPAVSARAFGFQPDERGGRLVLGERSRWIRWVNADGRARGELTVNAAAERPDGVHQATIFGREKRAGPSVPARPTAFRFPFPARSSHSAAVTDGSRPVRSKWQQPAVEGQRQPVSSESACCSTESALSTLRLSLTVSAIT